MKKIKIIEDYNALEIGGGMDVIVYPASRKKMEYRNEKARKNKKVTRINE